MQPKIRDERTRAGRSNSEGYKKMTWPCASSGRSSARLASGDGFHGRAQCLEAAHFALQSRRQVRLMIVVPRQGSIDLRQGKGGVVLLYGFGGPAIGDVIEHDLDDFDVGVVNPGASPARPCRCGAWLWFPAWG